MKEYEAAFQNQPVDVSEGHDGEVFYLGLALDPAYAEGFVEGPLSAIARLIP